MSLVARVAARVLPIAAAALLAGCATLASAPETGELLSGRLSVKVDGASGSAPRALSAGFELRGDPQAGRLDLSTPLGTVLAQARWAPGAVVLVSAQGERRFADLDALTSEVLGESLPVAALFDWLRGRPWSGAPSVAAPAAAGAGFEQLGWRVDLARFDEAWVVATRAQPPVVTVRARLDRP